VVISDEVIQQETVFDNNYSEQIPQESDIVIKEIHHGPQYEANWTFIDEEIIRITFALFSISKSTNEKKFPDENKTKKVNTFPTMVSIPSRSIDSIHSLKYFLFTIRQYKTNTEIVLEIKQLFLKNTTLRDYEHFSNSLQLVRLNPKEKYSICIYYYQVNNTIQMPDLLICQDIINDHLKHSVHGLLFILTQYSIIIAMLIVLQGLFSMRKRRLAHIIHQHFINKTQRIRSTLSSVSLIRQSFSSMDTTTTEQQNHTRNSHVVHYESMKYEENKLKKRIISSPAIILTESSMSSDADGSVLDENDPFIKLTSNKNHVHFLLGLDEGSGDDDDSEESVTDLQVPTSYREPYSDRADALLSMAHILDTNKPWCKHSHHSDPI
jgi:hypothetical protein